MLRKILNALAKILSVQQSGKKEGGSGGGNFCPPACRASRGMGWEAARPCVSKEAKPAKISFLNWKKLRAPDQKKKKFLRALLAAVRRRAAGVGIPRAKRAAIFPFSRIFDKVSSSRVVNILHDKTFRFFGNHFAGGTKRRPVRFEGEILSARRALTRLAALQNEVRWAI